jgi:hypothetical protein
VPVEIDDQEYLIAHGASRFLKAEKVQDMKRKGKSGDSPLCRADDIFCLYS